jgi:hypothetical protein
VSHGHFLDGRILTAPGIQKALEGTQGFRGDRWL